MWRIPIQCCLLCHSFKLTVGQLTQDAIITIQHAMHGQDSHLEPPLLLPWKLFSMSSWKVFPVRNLAMRSRASQMG